MERQTFNKRELFTYKIFLILSSFLACDLTDIHYLPLISLKKHSTFAAWYSEPFRIWLWIPEQPYFPLPTPFFPLPSSPCPSSFHIHLRVLSPARPGTHLLVYTRRGDLSLEKASRTYVSIDTISFCSPPTSSSFRSISQKQPRISDLPDQ